MFHLGPRTTSSAVPVVRADDMLSNCHLFWAGITRFDLLGDFGRFNWLGNFYIVLAYNLLFAIVTTLCLIRKFTSAVREELLRALGEPQHSGTNPGCSFVRTWGWAGVGQDHRAPQ